VSRWIAIIVAVAIAIAVVGCGKEATPAPEQFIQASIEGLRMQTAANASAWHFGEEARWDVDQDAGKITFTFNDGTIAESNVQIIGTYNREDGTFLWGWDHPSVVEPLRAASKLAHEWGTTNNVALFTKRMVSCTEDEAWGFTAVAGRLGGASGAYRGQSGTTLIYMTFGEVTLSKRGPASGRAGT
jgi:hypothetical protein